MLNPSSCAALILSSYLFKVPVLELTILPSDSPPIRLRFASNSVPVPLSIVASGLGSLDVLGLRKAID